MFQGYNPSTVDFLWGIRFNNERNWFLEHKQQYEENLLQPTKLLAAEVYEDLKENFPDEPFMYKVSRIYRDARRLHGRGPYKDHLWWSIRTGNLENWAGKPTFWFEISPDYYGYGLGFWCAPTAALEAYRKEIDLHPERLEILVKAFEQQEIFTLEGEEYKKPKGTPPKELAHWYQKKNINFCHEVPLDETIYTPELKTEIIEGFQQLMPFYLYLDEICARVPQDEYRKKND